jgi:hypothetical protein
MSGRATLNGKHEEGQRCPSFSIDTLSWVVYKGVEAREKESP